MIFNLLGTNTGCTYNLIAQTVTNTGQRTIAKGILPKWTSNEKLLKGTIVFFESFRVSKESLNADLLQVG